MAKKIKEQEDIEDNSEEGLSEYDRVRYAGFNNRLYAAGVDMLLLLAVLTPFFPMASFLPDTLPAEFQMLGKDIQEGKISIIEGYRLLFHHMVKSGIISRMFIGMAIQATTIGILCIFFWHYKSATPGKLLFKMRIVDAKTLGQPSMIQLITRYLAYFLSTIPFGFGFFWIAFNKQKRGWHDKLSGTMVIYNPGVDLEKDKRRKFIIQTIIAIAMLLFFMIFYASAKFE